MVLDNGQPVGGRFRALLPKLIICQGLAQTAVGVQHGPVQPFSFQGEPFHVRPDISNRLRGRLPVARLTLGPTYRLPAPSLRLRAYPGTRRKRLLPSVFC